MVTLTFIITKLKYGINWQLNICETLIVSLICLFQQLIKTLEVCDVPVRSGKFVVRKNWALTASVNERTLKSSVWTVWFNVVVHLFLRMICSYVFTITTHWNVFISSKLTMITFDRLLFTQHNHTFWLVVVSRMISLWFFKKCELKKLAWILFLSTSKTTWLSSYGTGTLNGL